MSDWATLDFWQPVVRVSPTEDLTTVQRRMQLLEQQRSVSRAVLLDGAADVADGIDTRTPSAQEEYIERAVRLYRGDD